MMISYLNLFYIYLNSIEYYIYVYIIFGLVILNQLYFNIYHIIYIESYFFKNNLLGKSKSIIMIIYKKN